MRKSYQPLLTTPLEIEVEGNVMAASVVDNSYIESTGQEIGDEFNFEDVSSFNQVWE